MLTPEVGSQKMVAFCFVFYCLKVTTSELLECHPPPLPPPPPPGGGGGTAQFRIILTNPQYK